MCYEDRCNISNLFRTDAKSNISGPQVRRRQLCSSGLYFGSGGLVAGLGRYAPISLATRTARNNTPIIDSMIVNDRAWREMAIMPDAPSEVMLVKLKKSKSNRSGTEWTFTAGSR